MTWISTETSPRKRLGLWRSLNCNLLSIVGARIQCAQLQPLAKSALHSVVCAKPAVLGRRGVVHEPPTVANSSLLEATKSFKFSDFTAYEA